jgi:hypothetical protein
VGEETAGGNEAEISGRDQLGFRLHWHHFPKP